MGDILLVANQMSYLAISLKNALAAADVGVVEFDAKCVTIPPLEDGILSVVLYLDESIITREDILVYVKDLATEQGIKIFLIGTPNELSDVAMILPPDITEERFTRPIDLSEVVKVLVETMSKVAVVKERTILAVDDSGVFLRQINSWFEDKYKVALANSAVNALKYLGSHKPDIILLDYEMPVVNGQQVLEMIRSDTECADIPVIFLTGNTNKDDIIKVMPLNVEGYLLKTLPPEQIIGKVDEFFEKKEQERKLKEAQAKAKLTY